MEPKIGFGWSKLPGDLQKRWPRDDAGEFVASKFLAWRQCVDLADEFLVNMLEAYGIPVLRRYAGDGSFGKVVLGMSGTGAELFVPETLYDTAKELMEAEIATEDEL